MERSASPSERGPGHGHTGSEPRKFGDRRAGGRVDCALGRALPVSAAGSQLCGNHVPSRCEVVGATTQDPGILMSRVLVSPW